MPELSGEHPPRARKPWQCQPWLESRYASPSYVGDWVYKISCQKASEEEGWFMSVIGEQTMDRILDVTDELQACVHEKFEPYEGVFRLC